jgi:hypothetical protein
LASPLSRCRLSHMPKAEGRPLLPVTTKAKKTTRCVEGGVPCKLPWPPFWLKVAYILHLWLETMPAKMDPDLCG